MEPILNGSFEHFPPEQLLSFLSQWRRSGLLEIRREERRARVFFENGTIVHAEGSPAAQVEEVLCGVFTWGAGSFAFLSPVPPPDGVPRLTIDVEAIIRKGSARAEESRSLFASEDVRLRVNDDQPNVSLTSDEFRVLLKVGKGCTLAELRAQMNRPATELYPIVQKLITARLLSIESAEPLPAEKAVPKARPMKIGSLTLQNGGVFPLLDDVYVIGRDPRSDLPVDDASVSSQHARLVRTEDGFSIEDVNSRNGTFVNSVRVTESHLLADADVIRLGRVRLIYNVAIPIAARDRTI